MATSIRKESGGSSTKRSSSGKPKKSKPPSFLEMIDESSDEDVGFSMMIYGKEGVGKSSLAAFAPSPIFLVDSQEHGIKRLKKAGLVPSSVKVGPDIQSWEMLLESLYELRDGDHSFETVVIDSLTGMQRLCFAACCYDEFDNDFSKEGFYSFGAGPKTAAQKYWPDFLGALTELQSQNINTITIAHSIVRTFENPEGPNYDRIEPDLDKAVSNATKRWAGSVLYARHNVDVSKEKSERKMKGKGGEQRIICTEYDAAYDAKNSYGFPSILEPFGSPEEGWNDIYLRIQQAQGKVERPKKKKRSV